MTSDKLFEKIRNRVGKTPEDRANLVRERMCALNARLERQIQAQTMTPEVLAKACTL